MIAFSITAPNFHARHEFGHFGANILKWQLTPKRLRLKATRYFESLIKAVEVWPEVPIKRYVITTNRYDPATISNNILFR